MVAQNSIEFEPIKKEQANLDYLFGGVDVDIKVVDSD